MTHQDGATHPNPRRNFPRLWQEVVARHVDHPESPSPQILRLSNQVGWLADGWSSIGSVGLQFSRVDLAGKFLEDLPGFAFLAIF